MLDLMGLEGLQDLVQAEGITAGHQEGLEVVVGLDLKEDREEDLVGLVVDRGRVGVCVVLRGRAMA